MALTRNAVSQTPAAAAWTHGLGLLLQPNGNPHAQRKREQPDGQLQTWRRYDLPPRSKDEQHQKPYGSNSHAHDDG